MNWLKVLAASRAAAEAQAKGKADLKPHHMRRLKQIWGEKYIASKGGSLNAAFEVFYSESMQNMYDGENVLLPLLKSTQDFTGQLYHVPVTLSLELK